MRKLKLLSLSLIAVGAGLITLITAMAQTRAPSRPAAAGLVDASGEMRLPDDYRTTYEYLGSWAVAADKGSGSKELHSVFASPGSIAAYRSSGAFPDGAVLVKEVNAAQTDPMTTGIVSRADALAGWFMMVKDKQNAYPNSKLWGDGWGWAWFSKANPNKAVTTDYRQECQTCHIPARDTDWIFTDGYSVLKR